MASICGNAVRNNAGTEQEFSNRDDAWKAYRLLCDYEAYLNQLVGQGRIVVVDPTPMDWPNAVAAADAEQAILRVLQQKKALPLVELTAYVNVSDQEAARIVSGLEQQKLVKVKDPGTLDAIVVIRA